MAVVRILAPADWHHNAAEALRRMGDSRAARELDRAAGRPSSKSSPVRREPIAELQADEVRRLAEALPGDEYVRVAVQELEEGQVRDRERIERLRLIQRRWPRETDGSLEA